MFEISSDCFTFISLHVVTFYFFSYLTDEKIKEAAGYANDRAEFVFYFIFFSVGLLLYMYEYVAFMPLWKAHVAYLSYHCLDYAELVLLSSETDSKATATAG